MLIIETELLLLFYGFTGYGGQVYNKRYYERIRKIYKDLGSDYSEAI
jgi:hypothetical protein